MASDSLSFIGHFAMIGSESLTLPATHDGRCPLVRSPRSRIRLLPRDRPEALIRFSIGRVWASPDEERLFRLNPLEILVGGPMAEVILDPRWWLPMEAVTGKYGHRDLKNAFCEARSAFATETHDAGIESTRWEEFS